MPNIRDKEGYSPLLYCACHENHENIAELLLQNGADVNECSRDGYSPL